MKTTERENIKIVGIECHTTVEECMKDNKMPKLWKKFMATEKKIKNRVDGRYYGMCIAEGECGFRYIAGVEVKDFNKIPKGFVKFEAPKSKYAVFTHKGNLDKLNETYGRIYEKDMPASKLKQKNIWFELYDERYKHDSDNSEFDIYCSVE
jgi:AraC family transcriptional regulator